jgi:hypothetical protein
MKLTGCSVNHREYKIYFSRYSYTLRPCHDETKQNLNAHNYTN